MLEVNFTLVPGDLQPEQQLQHMTPWQVPEQCMRRLQGSLYNNRIKMDTYITLLRVIKTIRSGN